MISQNPSENPSVVASVLLWLSCVATPTLHEFELDPSRTVGPHPEPKPIETLTMTRASATQATRRIVSSSSDSSSDSSLDCAEDMLTPDGDEARAAIDRKQVPRPCYSASTHREQCPRNGAQTKIELGRQHHICFGSRLPTSASEVCERMRL